MLQALEIRFSALRPTNIIKITAIFDAPYNTGATIDKYLPRKNNCIKSYAIPSLPSICTRRF